MERMMKKSMRFFSILLLTGTLTAFPACDSVAPAETTDPASSSTEAPVTEPVNELTEIENGRGLAGSYYVNTLANSVADPFIFYENGVYYLYCTGGSQFKVRTSKNLTSWVVQETPILKLSNTSWAQEKGWAPEFYKYNGKYYLIFSAKGKSGYHAIDIAVCDTPNGVFKPVNDQPLYAPDYSVIDASLLFDDDGRIYLFYSKDNSTNYVNGKRTSQTWGIELKTDFSGTIGEPVLISTPEQPWEMLSGSVVWNEGPIVFKENGKYYLLYSANYYQKKDYSVGYAVGETPLSFYKKEKNARILLGNGETVTGPGHCNIFRSPDGTELFLCYHVHTVPPTSDGGRSLAIDRLIVKEDGTLSVDGPSEVRRPLPSGLGGYTHIRDGFIASAEGEDAEFPKRSSTDYLFDGVVSRNFSDILSFGKDGGSLVLNFETPTTDLGSIWIYPCVYDGYAPASVDVEINGKYLIRDLLFLGTKGAPVTANLDKLPEGTAVESVRVIVHPKDGNSYAALAEVILISKKAQ